jgi:hypothetical protein
MKNSITCFVIIGFGKKTSYANGKLRVLDLDETYTLLIKPVFDSLGIPCYRAIDKNLSGSIDKLMLQEIKNADIVLTDISTLNANVMWELGVRHALKPRHTIMICEKEQISNIPFDINHFVVHQYTHSEEGIPYRDVERFKTYLTEIIKGVLNQNPKINDSPVFTFLQDLFVDDMVSAELSKDFFSDDESKYESFSSLLEKAEKAKSRKDYLAALKLFEQAKKYAINNMTLRDNLSFIISRQALCTYKSKIPNELESLVNAKIILDELNPQQNNDVEVLGITGAINKRLYDLTNDYSYLDNAILFYEKGFQLKKDYYNGINAAFMLYKKAWLLNTQHKDWEDIKLKADYIRNSVLEISLQLEIEKGFSEKKDAIWILLTIAEAYNYKRNLEKVMEYENKATVIAEETKDRFAISSYQEQKKKIEEMTIN